MDHAEEHELKQVGNVQLPFKGNNKICCKNAGTSELTDGEREKYLLLSYESRTNAMRPQ